MGLYLIRERSSNLIWIASTEVPVKSYLRDFAHARALGISPLTVKVVPDGTLDSLGRVDVFEALRDLDKAKYKLLREHGFV